MKSSTSWLLSRLPSLWLAFLLGVSSIALLGQQPTVSALPHAGPNRPAGVPADYVITPFGYLHPSCVLHLNQHEYVDNRAVLHHTDGSETQVASCQHPRFNPFGAPVSAAGGINNAAVQNAVVQQNRQTAVQPSIVHTWIEDSNAVTSSSYGKEVSTWTVPPSPLTQDGQTIFFFPGFVDLGDAQGSILQPVIGYNEGQWSMSSWNCCLAGVAAESTPYSINPGDTIMGTTQMTCPAGTTGCATWDVTTEDQSTHQTTVLSATPAQGQTFNWGFGGALEVYSVNQCLDYPPNASLTLTSLLYDTDLDQIAVPNWSNSLVLPAGSQPVCAYGVTTTPTQTVLSYGTTGPGFGLGIVPAAGIAVNQGGSASGVITSTDVNGFSGPVNIALSNVPAGITAQLTQGSSSDTYTLTLSAAADVPLTGTRQPAAITLNASGSGVATQAIPVDVIVNPPLTGGAGTAVDLSSAYNVYGFFDDPVGSSSLNLTGGLDGLSDVYSANQLSPPGLSPMGLNLNGVLFSFGKPNQLNAVTGKGGNPIPLPGQQFPTLQLLATGVNGAQPSQTIIVTYTDNTAQTFTQTFDDWSSTASCTSTNPCAPGESVALTMPYIDDANIYPRNDSIYYLYNYSFALNSTKTLKSLTLPSNRNVVLLAATLTSRITPTVTVTPGSSSITPTQPLQVTVAVAGASGEGTPTGTLTLAGGGYTSAIAALNNGSATITIPAGSLGLGIDTLTASYSGDNNYIAATGLAAVAVNAPAITVSATSLAFAPQNVGSSSVPHIVTLLNSGTEPLSIVSIAPSANFSETDNCGSPVTVGSYCKISVTFTPAAAGSFTGSLTITDNATDSPQTISLTGTGSTFALSSISGPLTIASPGGSATDTLQLAPSGGFIGTANLTCSVSYLGAGTANNPPLCSLSPVEVQITSGSAGNSTLTISTTAATSLLHPTNPFLPLSAPALAAVLFFCIAPRRRWHAPTLLVLLGIVLAGACAGCGGAASSNNPSLATPGTSMGNYSVTVTATSGPLTSSISVPVTLQ